MITPIKEKIAVAVVTSSGVGTTVMDFFNINAAGIGAICTVLSLIVYIIIAVIRLKKDLSLDEMK